MPIHDKKTKQDYIVEYIKNLRAVEHCMEPFKTQRRDLRQNYQDNKWLSREEIKMATKAYRMITSELDTKELMGIYEVLFKEVSK